MKCFACEKDINCYEPYEYVGDPKEAQTRHTNKVHCSGFNLARPVVVKGEDVGTSEVEVPCVHCQQPVKATDDRVLTPVDGKEEVFHFTCHGEWQKRFSKDTGRKDDNGKPRCDLLPPKALLGIARVLTGGAKEYGPNNWKKVDDLKARYTAALIRHLLFWMAGEEIDPKSGEAHLDHIACNAMFLSEAEKGL